MIKALVEGAKGIWNRCSIALSKASKAKATVPTTLCRCGGDLYAVPCVSNLPINCWKLQKRLPHAQRHAAHSKYSFSFYTPIHDKLARTFYTQYSIPLLLTFAFTTPPIPNAGTILHTLAAVLTPQFFHTIFALSPHSTFPPFPLSALLYRSNPSKCNGVEKTCIAAGATNCAVVCPPNVSQPFLSKCAWICGPRSGGRLKDAKMVMESLSANNVIVGNPTGLGEPVPNSCANFRSLMRQRLILAVEEAANLFTSAVT